MDSEFANIEKKGQVWVVTPHGHHFNFIDTEEIHQLDDALKNLRRDPTCRKVVICFRCVESTGWHALLHNTLVKAHKWIDERGGRLMLCELPEDILAPLRVNGLDRVLHIVKNLADATSDRAL